MKIDELRDKNPNILILSADDESPLFRKISVGISDLKALSDKLIPAPKNTYIADDPEAAKLFSVGEIAREVFAELPVQSGWCFGGNPFMNGMEWHKSSEVVCACTDCVLLLGSFGDIKDGKFDSRDAAALFLKSGEAVELLPMTLHLAPLPTEEFFKAAIILPKGTNAPLASGIEGTRRAVNKWLIIHKDNLAGAAAGGKIGVKGDNIRLNL